MRIDMRIGCVNLPNPFFMAPMAGVTDSVVRILARRYECAMVTTEMVAAHALARMGAAATLGRMSYLPVEKPIAIQIFGSNATVLAEAARRVEAAGADIVDINLGCSVPKIAAVGGGAALCRRPAALGQILEKVVRAVKVPVTVKIRKGWDDRGITAFEVLRVAEEAGVSALAIHSRTSEQAYSGRADWNFIGEMKLRARIPIVGNGDITCARDAVRMLEETGCDAVMIGRASRGNPWLFRECAHLWRTGRLADPPTPDEKFGLMLEHLDLLLQHYGEAPRVSQVRKLLGWYTRGLPHSAPFRESIHRIDDLDEMQHAVHEYFQIAQHAQYAA